MVPKIVSSHQPHFFPWLGYFDKMAKVDIFLINDVAQLELKSPMVRNKILNKYGNEQYIGVVVDKTGYEQKENREIQLKEWSKTRETLYGIIKDAYQKSAYYSEIWPQIDEILSKDYASLFELEMRTIQLGRDCLNINTPLKKHSELSYLEGSTTSERIALKLSSVGTNVYLSGNGAKKYMDLNDFNKLGIRVVYQTFASPTYKQYSSPQFIPNLSFIDILFNVGIDEARRLFWENVNNSNELTID